MAFPRKTLSKALHVKFFAALAVVGLLATRVAVGMTAGTTQAQSRVYPNPQPLTSSTG